jgi:hypothetical protein
VHLTSTLLTAASNPAGGAEIAQVIIATAGAAVVTAVVLWLCIGHRSGRDGFVPLTRMAAYAERVSGLPGWAALPSGVAAASLNVALLGMYWDISLHIDQGRDPGPLANPAHYLILAGLFGVFTAGVLAIALPVGDQRPGPAPVRLVKGWNAPIGGLLMAACGGFALIGFPLDDMWHRLFGQDVTLWGPTHLMLIGGAGMSLIGQAVLLAEGMWERRQRRAPDEAQEQSPGHIVAMRRVGLMGGLLIGLSTFQAEFDFGVPQFRMVFQPLLIAWAAGFALVAARLWIGRGGAIAAAVFFLGLRGLVSLLVGPVFGEITPSLALYLPEALLVEAAAVALARRPLALGVTGGLLCGTVGMAAEWGWSHVAMRLPWTTDILPEALVLAAATGVAGGLLGALLATGLRGELPRTGVARPVAFAAVAVLALCVADGLVSEGPKGERAIVDVGPVRDGAANATVRLDPDVGDGAAWVTATAWQGGSLHVDRLRRVSPGVYRTNEPVPLSGDWKALVRVHRGRQLIGAPIRLPGDPAIPAKAVPAPRHGEARAFTRDTEILQREQKAGVAGWLKVAAPLVVLALALAFAAALAWGVARVGRHSEEPPAGYRPRRSNRFAAARGEAAAPAMSAQGSPSA